MATRKRKLHVFFYEYVYKHLKYQNSQKGFLKMLNRFQYVILFEAL